MLVTTLKRPQGPAKNSKNWLSSTSVSNIAPFTSSLPSRYLPLKPTSKDLETSFLNVSDTPNCEPTTPRPNGLPEFNQNSVVAALPEELNPPDLKPTP